MECSSAGVSAVSVGEGGTSVCEEGEAGWLTSTPQLPRRPLHLLNTASPRTQLTPYRYHGCKAILEEQEDQENIDPSTRGVKDSCTSASASAKVSGMSPENTGSESSPFAYPLIWEASHTSSSSPSDGRKCHGDAGAWRSPISHYREQQGKGGEEGKEGGGKVRNRSGSSNEASCSKVACHGPSVTPSKATHTQTLTNTVFLTPSSSIHSGRPGEGRGGQTPKQQRVALSASHHTNPFEVGPESLYVSAVSPSLFQQVVSPSQKSDVNFRWSIDQMAALQPVNIETSPFTQVEALVDPDYERRAQDAIDRFFTTHQSVIPSPWTGSNKSLSVVKKMAVQQCQASPSLPPPQAQSVWCQTELSLPPVLPQAVEEALKPFCTFTQSQWWQGAGEVDEAASLNNTTLRRKLLFGHEDLTANTLSHGDSELPSPSAPHCLHGTSSPGHRAPAQGSEGEEGEESGLVWCTAVLGPGTSERGKEGTTLMWHSPPTTTAATATCRPGTLPLQYSCGTSILTSPDVSPIHHHQYGGESEARQAVQPCPSLEGSYLEQAHTSCTFISTSEAAPAPACPQPHTPPLPGISHPSGADEEWGGNGEEKKNFSSPHSSPQPHVPCLEVLESEVHMRTQQKDEEEEEEEEDMQRDQREVQKLVNLSESFCSHYAGKEMKAQSPTTSSPTAELRCSSNSDHFSSSPIHDISHSPLEVDSPGKRFSASPPLSPILCRPLLFPPHPCRHLQSLPLVKERKEAAEVTMMEEAGMGVPEGVTTLPHCSSLCDVEMDSQPSVESNLGEEAASQDTGYQTVSSLLTSNFSCTTTFPQDLPPPPPLQETGTSTKQLPSTAASKDFRA